MVLEVEELRNPETGEFLGFGAPTGELIEDTQHNDRYKLTDGWFDFDIETNQWVRTQWDSAGEEWYVRDNYRGYNPWRVPKYGPEPKQEEVPDEKVVTPTKTSVVSKEPEAPTLPRKPEPRVQPRQKTVTSVKPDGSRGRKVRIQGR